jgi:hypothetical protein
VNRDTIIFREPLGLKAKKKPRKIKGKDYYPENLKCRFSEKGQFVSKTNKTLNLCDRVHVEIQFMMCNIRVSFRNISSTVFSAHIWVSQRLSVYPLKIRTNFESLSPKR